KVVLNNRIRSDTQLPSSQVQAKLEHEIISTLTPAPELFVQATRVQTPAIMCQPDSLTARQITKLVDFVTEREALPRGPNPPVRHSPRLAQQIVRRLRT